jgi:spore cortex biosynthesis protein YabQ
MGIAFDSYRVISGELRFPRWSVHVIDLMYWIAASLFVFRNLYHSNHGELRFYVFLGLFIGIWIHFLLLSVITERFVLMLMRMTRRVYWVIVRLIKLLIITPIRWLLKLIRVLLGFFGITLLFIGRITLLPLWKLLVWVTSPIIRRLGVRDRYNAIREWLNKIWQLFFGKK